MQNVTNRNFHRLINKQRASITKEVKLLVIDSETIQDPLAQAQKLAGYYANLATPKINPDFDTEHHEMVCDDIDYIRLICDSTDIGTSITMEDTCKAIKNLNRGKAADEHNIKAEVLQKCLHATAPILQKLYEQCRIKRQVPDHFKKGILMSIPKKCKPPEIPSNHRGITVSVLLCLFLRP